jgi:uncharacterized membrane protein YfcA
MTAYEVIVLLVIGLLGGFVAGSLGVGGGIIIVPSLIFLLGLTQHQAQGTSLAMMLAPIGILAAINYYREGHINIGYAIILMIVFIVGGYFGSMFAIKLPATALKKIFGILMLIVGLRMIFWS